WTTRKCRQRPGSIRTSCGPNSSRTARRARAPKWCPGQNEGRWKYDKLEGVTNKASRRLFTEHIDAVRKTAGAETVVDVHHPDTARTGVQHRQECSQSVKARSVATTGGHRHNGAVHQSPHDTR